MKCMPKRLLFLALLMAPTYLLADNWPAGMTNISGTSFAVIYRDDDGRYIAQLPSERTIEVQSICGTDKPLWLYGSPKPGRCLAVMPERLSNTGIVELQVTFPPKGIKQISLLSTHFVRRENLVLAEPGINERLVVSQRLARMIKKGEHIRQIRSVNLEDHQVVYFVSLDEPSHPADETGDYCGDLKTLVLMRREGGYENMGVLDNMPDLFVRDEKSHMPMALTHIWCGTEASLWKIYPMVENVANFSNGVGG